MLPHNEMRIIYVVTLQPTELHNRNNPYAKAFYIDGLLSSNNLKFAEIEKSFLFHVQLKSYFVAIKQFPIAHNNGTRIIILMFNYSRQNDRSFAKSRFATQ